MIAAYGNISFWVIRPSRTPGTGAQVREIATWYVTFSDVLPGNAWAAAGMMRVLQTIRHSSQGWRFESQGADLTSWITEIVSAAWTHQVCFLVFFASLSVTSCLRLSTQTVHCSTLSTTTPPSPTLPPLHYSPPQPIDSLSLQKITRSSLPPTEHCTSSSRTLTTTVGYTIPSIRRLSLPHPLPVHSAQKVNPLFCCYKPLGGISPIHLCRRRAPYCYDLTSLFQRSGFCRNPLSMYM